MHTRLLLPVDLPSSWGKCALDSPNVSCDFVIQWAKYMVAPQTSWILITIGCCLQIAPESSESYHLIINFNKETPSVLQVKNIYTDHMITVHMIHYVSCYIPYRVLCSILTSSLILEVQEISSFEQQTIAGWGKLKQRLSSTYANEAVDTGGKTRWLHPAAPRINRFGFKSKTGKRQMYTDTPTCERTSVMGSHFPNLLWWIQAMIFI